MHENGTSMLGGDLCGSRVCFSYSVEDVVGCKVDFMDVWVSLRRVAEGHFFGFLFELLCFLPERFQFRVHFRLLIRRIAAATMAMIATAAPAIHIVGKASVESTVMTVVSVAVFPAASLTVSVTV